MSCGVEVQHHIRYSKIILPRSICDEFRALNSVWKHTSGCYRRYIDRKKMAKTFAMVSKLMHLPGKT